MQTTTIAARTRTLVSKLARGAALAAAVAGAVALGGGQAQEAAAAPAAQAYYYDCVWVEYWDPFYGYSYAWACDYFYY